MTAFSIINRCLCFVDAEENKLKNEWKLNEEWVWFIKKHGEATKLTIQPKPFTLERAIKWLYRQAALPLNILLELDRQNHTTILKDVLKQAELNEKHKHSSELKKQI